MGYVAGGNVLSQERADWSLPKPEPDWIVRLAKLPVPAVSPLARSPRIYDTGTPARTDAIPARGVACRTWDRRNTSVLAFTPTEQDVSRSTRQSCRDAETTAT
jgi:hypothetical protein